jgi:predicted nuclease of predicted toxin-antitoxin system
MDYLRRRAKVRFYADENFPYLATRMLRRFGAQVVTVQDAGLRRHPDENHAAYALRYGYVLLTCDRDYLDNRKFPLIHCPAIAVFDFGKGSPREILAALQCLRTAFRIPQFYDKWMKIEAAKDSWLKPHVSSMAPRRAPAIAGSEENSRSGPSKRLTSSMICPDASAFVGTNPTESQELPNCWSYGRCIPQRCRKT